MARNGDDVRKRLQWAALELFRKHGYDHVTALEIAEKAGVTERTFFRHFPDKREVLFDGDTAFTDALATAVRSAPKSLAPWPTLLFAFDAVKQTFVDNRPFTEPRQDVIAASPALQERAMAKTRSLVAAVTAALTDRGLPTPEANLAAWMGMAVLSYGVAAWFKDGSIDLGEHIRRAFQQAGHLAHPAATLTKPKSLPKPAKPRPKSRKP